MKKVFFILTLFIISVSIISLNNTSAEVVTISTNATYLTSPNHDPNSVSGVLFVPEINITLVSIRRSPLDTAPFCLVIDSTTNAVLVNAGWTNNICYTNNLQLRAGSIYRIGTGADSGSYQVTYDQSYSPANYPGIGNFPGGCYGGACNIHVISGTMYSIESITLDDNAPLPPAPPVLLPIGNQSINENQTLTIQLQATDPNLNDTLTFLTNAQTVLLSPSFLNSTSGLFTWTPSFSEQGIYYVNFYVTDGQFMDYETVRIHVIDVSFATITISGSPSIGNNLILSLHDPRNPNKPYVLSAAFGSSPGIPLADGRIVPLNEDWLFNAVLYVPSLFGFSNSIGILDSQGNAQVTWAIPNLQFFQNANISFSFATLNHGAPGLQVIDSIAPAVNVTIQ